MGKQLLCETDPKKEKEKKPLLRFQIFEKPQKQEEKTFTLEITVHTYIHRKKQKKKLICLLEVYYRS